MKTYTMTFLAGVTAATLGLTPLTSFGKSGPHVESLRQTLSQVSAPELPVRASQIVAAAKTSEKESVTISVVLAALDLKPTTAPALVGAIARRTPEVAATAAVTAALRQPKQVEAIIKAAVAAAPSQVGKIVFAVCQAFPTKYNTVAIAAYQAAPKAGAEILKAVGLAIPAVKPLLERATGNAGKSDSFLEVIFQTENMLLAGARTANTTPESYLASTTPPVPASTSRSNPQALPPPPSQNEPFTPQGKVSAENDPNGNGKGHGNHGHGHGNGHGHHYSDP